MNLAGQINLIFTGNSVFYIDSRELWQIKGLFDKAVAD